MTDKMCYGGRIVDQSLVIFLLFFLGCVIQGVISKDICATGTSREELTSALHPGALPKGGFQAGNFSKDPKALKLSQCILSCCTQDTCDAVFFFHNPKHDTEMCYLIQCNRTYPGSCDPGEKDSTSNKTYFVTVRDVAYSQGGSAPVLQEGACNLLNRDDSGCRVNEECRLKPAGLSFQTECVCSEGYRYDENENICKKELKATICNPDKMNDCHENEECYIPPAISSNLGVCVCMKGYEKDTEGVCRSIIPKPSFSRPAHHKLHHCEYGLHHQCDKHEECFIPPHSHSRLGTCICKEGYQFDENYNCKSIADSTTPSTTTLKHKPTYCEFGLNQCDVNEECYIPDNSHSRTGVCICLESYQRDDNYTCVNVSLGDLDLTGSKENKSSVTPSPTPLPTTTAATTTPAIEHLTVSAGENKEIQLPKNEVTLNAYVISKEDNKDKKFDYEWSLISMPEGAEIGTMVGKNTDTLQLSKLIEGLYSFKIVVKGPHQEGESFVNVTVLPAARQNTPPVAVIKPVNQVVKLPNSAILDGSDSTDDDKIVKYHWEEKSGPLQDHQLQADTSMLTLKDLAPGIYIFELTVTDSDGATNSTSANVTFIKEMDYPPKANAGSDVVIHLPQNSLVLNGNLSTDDKGIESYEWIKSADDKLAADMTGVRTPFLHLSNLQEGDYTFTLKVTDTAKQSSSADVHVFVKKDSNHPPVAIVSGPKTLFLPLDSIKLDGSNSTDDKGIVSYSWEQIKGNALTIKNPKEAVTMATGEIKSTQYEFVLTVKDVEGTSSVISYIVNVNERPNTKPIANAGVDQVLTLPVDLVVLDGSKSSDDKRIEKYSWTRESTSLAAGDPLNGSDHKAVLQLVNMVEGQYTFKLTVVDAEGLSASDTASVLIRENPHENDMIELDIEADIKQFTQQDKANLQSQLQLMLPDGDKSKVVMDHIKEDTETSLMKVFFHIENSNDPSDIRNGAETSQLLKEKLRLAGNTILSYSVANMDTIICQNNCSGHGHCDKKTRNCICDAFWMENFFQKLVLHGDSNCDWSILYFIIVTFLIVIVIAALVWGFICWFKNRRCRFRWRTKKRHRYSLLQDSDYKDEIKLLPKGKTQSSSVMISESDFTSDEETLFVNHKKNGFIKKPPNGINKQHLKNKMKA